VIFLNNLNNTVFCKIFAFRALAVCKAVCKADDYVILSRTEVYWREGNIKSFNTKNTILFFFFLLQFCNRVIFCAVKKRIRVTCICKLNAADILFIELTESEK